MRFVRHLFHLQYSTFLNQCNVTLVNASLGTGTMLQDHVLERTPPAYLQGQMCVQMSTTVAKFT